MYILYAYWVHIHYTVCWMCHKKGFMLVLTVITQRSFKCVFSIEPFYSLLYIYFHNKYTNTFFLRNCVWFLWPDSKNSTTVRHTVLRRKWHSIIKINGMDQSQIPDELIQDLKWDMKSKWQGHATMYWNRITNGITAVDVKKGFQNRFLFYVQWMVKRQNRLIIGVANYENLRKRTGTYPIPISWYSTTAWNNGAGMVTYVILKRYTRLSEVQHTVNMHTELHLVVYMYIQYVVPSSSPHSQTVSQYQGHWPHLPPLLPLHSP